MTAKNSDLLYRLLVQSVVDYAIYMLTPEGIVSNWNLGAQRAKGYQADEIIGQHFGVFYTPEDRAAGLPQRALEVARRDLRFESEGWRLRKDGSRFWTSVVIDAIHDEAGALLGFAKITRDITERREHELSLLRAKERAEQVSQQMHTLSRFLDSIISNVPGSVLALDVTTNKILLANQQARRLFGAADVDLPGLTPSQALAPEIAAYIAQQAAPAPPPRQHSESLVQTGLGARMLRTRTVFGNHPDDDSGYALLITEDVTEELAAYEQIHHMAQHDALTNLPNRTLFHQRLQQAIHDGDPGAGSTAVLFLDLDNFKNINDALGHAFGDKVLLALGRRLKKTLREQDTLARLGGDEFAIVLPAVRRVDEARWAAQRLIDAVQPVFLIDGQSVAVGVSIGIAVGADADATAEQLLRFADMALYEAKHNGRNRYEFFHQGLDAASRRRRQMEIDLRLALRLGQLHMYFQPIVARQDGKIIGYEALMRWQHPVQGQTSPAEFIPIAEQTGLIHELGALALRLACQAAVQWDDDASVAVNLSPLQFKSSKLVATVARALDEFGLAPHRLELEITESVLLDNTEENIRTLGALKGLGVDISLDDFGTGYSSLSYLRSFPFDRIKIDKSFIHAMGESREALAIVRAIMGLSNSLLIKTTAEGVETKEQLTQLLAEGCTHFQGYWFGRPEPLEKRVQQLNG